MSKATSTTTTPLVPFKTWFTNSPVTAFPRLRQVTLTGREPRFPLTLRKGGKVPPHAGELRLKIPDPRSHALRLSRERLLADARHGPAPTRDRALGERDVLTLRRSTEVPRERPVMSEHDRLTILRELHEPISDVPATLMIQRRDRVVELDRRARLVEHRLGEEPGQTERSLLPLTQDGRGRRPPTAPKRPGI